MITITGKPCSGKSTVAKILASKYGFEHIAIGNIFKEEANKRGITIEEFNKLCSSDSSFDQLIDNETARIGRDRANEKLIFDSRMAWHFVPHSFKVYLDLSEDEMANRLLNSDRKDKYIYKNKESALNSLLNREKLEIERYNKLYNVNMADPNNYDLVISSENISPEALADIIYSEYLKHIENSKK